MNEKSFQINLSYVTFHLCIIYATWYRTGNLKVKSSNVLCIIYDTKLKIDVFNKNIKQEFFAYFLCIIRIVLHHIYFFHQNKKNGAVKG